MGQVELLMKIVDFTSSLALSLDKYAKLARFSPHLTQAKLNSTKVSWNATKIFSENQFAVSSLMKWCLVEFEFAETPFLGKIGG